MADSMENTVEEEVIIATVELPDIDETQIWDDEQDKREVCLYLETKNGRVQGMEYVPFELPYRWTFATLKSCVHDFVARMVANGDKSKVEVNQLYFKKSGNSKSLVVLNSDRDVPAMLQEYPLQYPSGKRRTGRKAVITMAVDWTAIHPIHTHTKESPSTPQQNSHSRKSLQCLTPRRSPRLADKNRKPETETPKEMDVFVFEVMKGKNSNEPKLSKTTTILHNVSQNCNVQTLKDRLLIMDTSTSYIFVPAKGLYWLRKRSKQMVQLKTEEDWRLCKEEYSDGKGNISSVRIACSSVTYKSSGAAGDTTASRKRSLDFDSSSPNADMEEVQKKKIKATDNELWNDVHISLVRDLERKGIIARYGVKHLRLWTDLIIDGSSTGIGDEPNWENYVDQVGIPPKTAREQSNSTQKGTPTDDLLKTLIVQNQQRMEIESKRAETFQNSLLAIISRPSSQTPVHELQRSKPLLHFGTAECCNFLEKHHLDRFIPQFVQAGVNGSLLATLVNPYVGESILHGLSITSESDKEAIIQAVNQEMSPIPCSFSC